MHIQWFPGHMNKARQELKKALPNVDLLIEVLDARLPFSSENPMLTTIRGEKPCIKLLNKADLADAGTTRIWQDYLEQAKQVKTLAISMEKPEKIQTIPDLCRKMVPAKVERGEPIYAAITGIPNVGKSTIINTLAGRGIAKTGNEPAVTKMQQRIDLKNGIILIDTPGMLWPRIDHENSAYRLAASGAIKDTAFEYDDLAFFLAEYLLESYTDNLVQRYEMEELPRDTWEFMETVGRQRGCLRAGGNIDMNKASKILVNEFRMGTLGRITLELPEMTERELIEVRVAQEAKEARKAARKMNRKKKNR
jgi:ribosome biogenesis GTPase A